MMQKGIPHIKMFSSLSDEKLVFCTLPYLNILCISLINDTTLRQQLAVHIMRPLNGACNACTRHKNVCSKC